MSKKKIINGVTATESDIRASLSRDDGSTALPNLLYGRVDDENRQPLLSLWMSATDQLNDLGQPTSFGRMRWQVPFEGSLRDISVVIDRVTAKYLKQSQFGPDVVAAADGSLHVRSLRIYDGCQSFAAFLEGDKAKELAQKKAEEAGVKRRR